MFKNKNGYYYFNKKIDGKVVKISLKTRNIVEAMQLAMYYKNIGFNKMNVYSHIQAKESENEKVVELEKELKMLFAKFNVKNFQVKTPADSPELKKSFFEFIDYKKDIDKVQPASIKLYNTAYKHLLSFTKENEKIGNFDKNFFKEVEEGLARLPVNYDKYNVFNGLKANQIIKHPDSKTMQKMQNKTINNLMTVYKMFFEYCIQKDYIDISPLSSFKLLKEDKNNYQKYTHEDLVKLFKYIKMNKLDEMHEICFLLLSTGMRIGELANMKYKDLFLDKKNILAKIPVAKTDNGIRTIAFHTFTNTFKCFENIENKKNENYLFMNDKDFKDRPDAFSKAVMKVIRKVITDKTKVIHSFRSNFIGELYKNNIEEVLIKQFVGHSNEKNITYSVYNKQDIENEQLIKIVNSITNYGTLFDDVSRAISKEYELARQSRQIKDGKVKRIKLTF